ncbi:MAG: dihydrolipoyllysine-residue acetyltransferase [Betaproteobacteria bacterium]|nr:dihydrolipoyllysine-residue acetyltransferase [Betaproteobacteria bacterium]
MATTSTKLSAGIKQVLVPDIGNFKDVEIIEVMVKAGDTVKAEDALLTLETDKATMDVPSPFSGVVKEVKVKVGGKVSEGALVALIEVSGEAAASAAAPAAPAPATKSVSQPQPPIPAPAAVPTPVLLPRATSHELPSTSSSAHASPSIRRFARELGVNLPQVKGSGEKGRVTREDVQNFVKAALAQPRGAGGGLQVAEMPVVDFARFGAVESKPLSRIKKLSGAWLHRNWVSIPHITQHDEADITEMEAFRKQLGTEYAAQGIKITPLAFLLRAVVEALQQFPDFNASLDASGENLVLKKYFHIGVAVDTPEGLVVPVLRDVNQKGIVQLAKELAEISGRAREKKITAAEMQGGCFTISSLGGIGGTSFTPIINAPEVAILGVSRSSMKPVWKDCKFEPRLMLPLSLSYDHRVIDGAAGVRFTTYLAQVLSDVRRLAL